MGHVIRTDNSTQKAPCTFSTDFDSVPTQSFYAILGWGKALYKLPSKYNSYSMEF